MPAGIVTPCSATSLHRAADVVLGRRLVAQQFLDRGGDLAAIVEQFLPLVGDARERHRRVADQLGDGLRARAAQKRCESGDLEVVSCVRLAVFALDLGGDQPADHVVLRFGAALLNQLVVEPHDFATACMPCLGHLDLAGLAVQGLVHPLPDLLAVFGPAHRASG